MPRAPSYAEDRRKLDKLRALRLTPAAAREYAVELLAAGGGDDVLLGALAVLREHPVAGMHDVLVARYRELDANPKRHDPVGQLRTAILSVIRHELTQADRDLVLRAVSTYERGLQGPTSTGIRAAGLVCLAGLDPTLAALYAAKYLGEVETPRGEPLITLDAEPMLTAVRVLYSSGQTAAIYAFLVATRVPVVGGQRVSEPRAEAIRLLTDLPDALAAGIAARFVEEDAGDDLVFLGIGDLLVNHEGGPATARELRAMLQLAGHYEAYQYLCAAIVASRRKEHLAALIEQCRGEQDRTKAEIAVEALKLTHDPAAVAALPDLASRAASLTRVAAPARVRPAYDEDD